MDISYLLMLQEFRNGAGSIFTSFLLKMSDIGEMSFVLTVMAVIYWCVSKEYGAYFLLGWTNIRIVNGFLKVFACVYRPWIRDSRIVPEKTALEAATGYSFPSGHSMNASALYGGAVIRKEFSKALRISMGIIFVLIPFSRNFLGVHTHYDVLVGMASGLLIMWLTIKLMNWIEAHPEKDIIVMSIGILIAILVAVFAAVKPYPVDYDAEGKILVDGAKMANDTFKAVGWSIGFLVGWVLERRLVRFSTDISLMMRVTRFMTGLLGHYAISYILVPVIKAGISGPGGTMASCLVQMFYVSFIFPWCIKTFEKQTAE